MASQLVARRTVSLFSASEGRRVGVDSALHRLRVYKIDCYRLYPEEIDPRLESKAETRDDDLDLRPYYDFSGGVRGKYVGRFAGSLQGRGARAGRGRHQVG